MNVPLHQITFSTQAGRLLLPTAEAIRDHGGGTPYRMWFLDDARELLGDVYGLDVLQAFDCLQPLAYKADLARYCIVHHFGGLYVDLSVTDFVGFELGDNEFVGFRDPNSDATSWKVGNHMFYAVAGSPILNYCISECVENIRNRFYGKDPHWPTGPSVLGRAVARCSPDVEVLIGDYWWLKRRRNKYTLPGQGVVARGKRGGRFQGGISGVPGGNNYNVLWNERAVYE